MFKYFIGLYGSWKFCYIEYGLRGACSRTLQWEWSPGPEYFQ